MDVETVTSCNDPCFKADAYIQSAQKRNVPLILRGAGSHWPAVGKWNLEYIEQSCRGAEATCMLYGGVKPDAMRIPVEQATSRISKGEPLYISQATAMFGRGRGSNGAPPVPQLPTLGQDCV